MSFSYRFSSVIETFCGSASLLRRRRLFNYVPLALLYGLCHQQSHDTPTEAHPLAGT
jgi:hypothetical protein